MSWLLTVSATALIPTLLAMHAKVLASETFTTIGNGTYRVFFRGLVIGVEF